MIALWMYSWTSWPVVGQRATVSATVSILDQGAPSGLVKTISTSLVGSGHNYGRGFVVNTTPTALTLPAAVVQALLIVNTGNTPVTISWAIEGGALVVVETLQVGDFIALGKTSIGSGITAISAQAGNAAGAIDYLLSSQ